MMQKPPAATVEDGPRSAEPPLHLLEPFERAAFRAMHALEERGMTITEPYLRGFGSAWMWLTIHRVATVHGLERLAGVRADQSILLVANHRTYFDLYALGVLLHQKTPLHQPVFCPVRADFFYERPLGVLVNLVVGGGRMFPPVFRDPAKADFNKWSVNHLVELMRKKSVLVGFHPEGTRNKNEDPYTPLPAQPGVGKIVMETWPVIVPAFINGLSGNLFAQARDNVTRAGRVVAVFGEPVDTTPWRKMGNRLASHKRIADRLLEIIYGLGEEERAIRAALPVTD